MFEIRMDHYAFMGNRTYMQIREIFIAVHFSNEWLGCAVDLCCGCGRRKSEVCAPMSMWLRAECSSNSLDILDDDLHEHSINFKHFIVI